MRTIIALALLAVAAPVAAQHDHHGSGFPAGWQGRVDRADQKLEDVRFMAMGGGFHVITGPHVILWNPSNTASGAYTASASFRLARQPEHPEGFGLVVGGAALDQPNQDYLYFLARHDGSFMVRHRAGTEIHTLTDWTQHDAIRRPSGATGADNTLAIEASADRVRFLINGTEVYALARVPMLNTDGIVGFRVGHRMDVHISNFSIQR